MTRPSRLALSMVLCLGLLAVARPGHAEEIAQAFAAPVTVTDRNVEKALLAAIAKSL